MVWFASFSNRHNWLTETIWTYASLALLPLFRCPVPTDCKLLDFFRFTAAVFLSHIPLSSTTCAFSSSVFYKYITIINWEARAIVMASHINSMLAIFYDICDLQIAAWMWTDFYITKVIVQKVLFSIFISTEHSVYFTKTTPCKVTGL